MKFSWGTGIAVFYSAFVIVMVSMVIKSTHNKAQMVQENYYDKDLNYEAFRLKRENANNMKIPVKIQVSNLDQRLNIEFPKSMLSINGQVELFRPSNESMDVTYPIQLSHEGVMTIPLDKNIERGLWRIQVDWQSNGTGYYKEELITL